MKLIDNLYSINAREFDKMGDKAIFGISLNADNVIYKAHFPSNPITPGVCLIQIALEITELCKNTDLEIKKLLKYMLNDFVILEFYHNNIFL